MDSNSCIASRYIELHYVITTLELQGQSSFGRVLKAHATWPKCSKSRDLVRLRFAIRIANRKSLAIWRARRCDSAAIWKRLFFLIINRAIWTAIWSVFASDLGDILAIWAPRFEITSDLRFVIWSTQYMAQTWNCWQFFVDFCWFLFAAIFSVSSLIFGRGCRLQWIIWVFFPYYLWNRVRKCTINSLGVLLPRPFVAKNPFGKLR